MTNTIKSIVKKTPFYKEVIEYIDGIQIGTIIWHTEEHRKLEYSLAKKSNNDKSVLEGGWDWGIYKTL